MRKLLLVLAFIVVATVIYRSVRTPAPAPKTAAVEDVTPNVIPLHGFTVALDSRGKVWTWGSSDDSKRLGQGATERLIDSPRQIEGLTNIVSVAAQSEHVLALESNGTIWGWGRLHGGTEKSRPKEILTMRGAKSVATSAGIVLVLKWDGTVWGWGTNAAGALGMDRIDTYVDKPVQVLGLANVKAIAAANNTYLALLQDGSVKAWGNNLNGHLGVGHSPGYPGEAKYRNENLAEPSTVIGLKDVTHIVVGPMGHSMLALTERGKVIEWGFHLDRNQDVVTGDAVPGLDGVTSISHGGSNAVATKLDGSVWQWGRRGVDVVGGKYEEVPVRVSWPGAVRAAWAGPTTQFGLAREGFLVGWGRSSAGELGVPGIEAAGDPIEVPGFVLVKP